jgi:hypothetical protein
LPGGRFEEGEFVFDSLFDEAVEHPDDITLRSRCDPIVRHLILNFFTGVP